MKAAIERPRPKLTAVIRSTPGIVRVVVLFAVWYAVGRHDPSKLLMAYPLWATIAAMNFLAHATEAGIYFMVAALAFGLSVLMACAASYTKTRWQLGIRSL